jgi:TetR/AcrR family acrAB operon transcriptional repressor
MQTDHTIADKRRERILDVAARLILRYGYDKTTLQDIASDASISKSTLYQYWKNKEELFGALITRETRQMLNEWLERVQADPGGGTLFGIYRHGFLILLAHPLMMAFYTKESPVLGDYVRQRGPAVYVRPYLLSRVLVEQLQVAGLIRDNLSPQVINHLLMILSVGLFSISELIPQEQAPPFEEVADALARMVQRALASEQPGDSEQGKRAFRTYLEQLACGSAE